MIRTAMKMAIEIKRKGNYRQLSRETQETESLLNRPRRPSWFLRASVDHGHGFDLDQRARDGETGHLHQGTGRRVSAQALLAYLPLPFPIACFLNQPITLPYLPTPRPTSSL